jgi:hypothetical protein
MAVFARRALAVRIGVFAGAALLFALTHRSLGFWNIDDAGITYAYSIGLADRGSLSPLPESLPVEGYSNPLLFALVALLRLVGLFDPITTPVTLAWIVFGAMAVLVFEFLQGHSTVKVALAGTGLFVALELVNGATWLWYRSGLENIYVSFGLVALVVIADRSIRSGRIPAIMAGLAAAVVALMRPEAPVYAAAFYGVLLVLAKPADGSWRSHLLRVLPAAALTASVYVGFLLWRHATYGEWLPNTYFAKLGGGPNLTTNITTYVVPSVFPYGHSLVFGLTPVVLAVLVAYRRLAGALGAFAAAALVMPVVGGYDWMGEHRFATPFFVIGHLSAVALLVILFTQRDYRSDARRLLLVLATVPIVASLVIQLVTERPAGSTATIARVMDVHGVTRMQHQRRLGLIDPVVIAPDAGGLLLYGSLQHIDNGYLTDYQMSHIERDLAVITQYEIAERDADLADTNAQWPFDRSLVGPRYVGHDELRMFARRDLVDLDAAPTTSPFFEEAGVRVYLSPATVSTTGPRGLLRIELYETWDSGAPGKDLTAVAYVSTPGYGDNDKISLEPYHGEGPADPTGMQRRALLLRAPEKPGTYDVTVEIKRDGNNVAAPVTLKLEVVEPNAVGPAVDKLLNDPLAPDDLMRRFAWLREQMIPRLSQVQLRRDRDALVDADVAHKKSVSSLMRRLTWDARLAVLTDELPSALRAAEQQVVERFVASRGCDTEQLDAKRALCFGRAVDALRRFGYFGVLKRVPAVRADLDAIRAKRGSFAKADRYIAAVGLFLAMPDRIDVNKELASTRSAFAKTRDFPQVGSR